MRIIDITGLLSNKMWEFGPPFPVLNIEEKHGFKEGFGNFSYTSIEGLHGLSGTYVETPAHYHGYENSYLIADVPLERLVNIDCVVLNVRKPGTDGVGRIVVDLPDLLACKNSADIQEGDAVLVGVGWGDKMWFSERHFSHSPYFTLDAFMWLLSKKPSLIGTDTSSWENLSSPAGFFESFYQQDILMLAGLQNLAAVSESRVKLSVLPLKLDNSCASPCRAFIIEGD